MGVKLLIEEDKKGENPSQREVFPKSCRLRKKSEFRALFQSSKRRIGKFLSIDFELSECATSRLGITAPARYGNAIERNRFKRLAREAFRKIRAQYPHLNLNLFPLQKAKSASFDDIYRELKWHLDAIKSSTEKSDHNH